MKIYALIPLLALLVLGACSSNKTFLNTEQKLLRADELFARGKYARAAELYGEVYFERASASTAHALMRQGDSYFRLNRFTDARLAYSEFADAFPNHPEVSTAVFRTAVCLFEESLSAHYDQSETLHAIDAFRKFIGKYPTDARYDEALQYSQKAQYKLIEKKFLNGYIYFKMKDYSSALMYFREVTELGNSDRLDRESLYYTALLLRRQQLHEPAREAYDALRTKYPGSKESKKLARIFK
ncbi:MAG: outer membrane protein assembly factor BamD [Candidatus Syntrophosphaera sp.]|nr:outer membrane protein assembly factor BamD [Candidatus Syntrophosphaera sp.]